MRKGVPNKLDTFIKPSTKTIAFKKAIDFKRVKANLSLSSWVREKTVEKLKTNIK